MSFKRRVLSALGKELLLDAASYLEDAKAFAAGLGKLGFDVTTPTVEGAFVRIYAHKNSTQPDPALVLPFRGAVKGE